MPRITVIIPVRNDPQRLARCLKALSGSSFTDFEVIVADDASSDDTRRVAESAEVKVVRLARRSGAAAARNAAAELASGEILLFVDADVCVHPNTLAVAAASFDDPGVDAVFGSYDLEPAEQNLLSQYKNLAHRFYHQISNHHVSTFWSGCGAIRRDVFSNFKFDAERFTRPSIEDIDLGARLSSAGRKIIINKDLQAKHLKRWTLPGIFRSDLFDRAIPWTRLILRQQHLPGDLNLSSGQRLAALLTALSAAIFLIACCFKPWLALLPVITFGAIALADRFSLLRGAASVLILAATAGAIFYGRGWAAAIFLPLLAVVLINWPFYRFFLGHRGLLFTITVVPMQLAYYLYSMMGFAAGTLLHWRDSLDDFAVRVRIYIGLAIMLYACSWGLVLARAHFKHTTIDFAVSDAIGYYAYLPSLVLDHDLQFDNQLAAQFPVVDKDYEDHMRHNRWPIGLALSIAPAFLFAHGLTLLLHHFIPIAMLVPNGYTPLYFVFTVAWTMAIGTLGMILADRLLVERWSIRGRIAGAAVLTTWLGTNYFWYFTREPLLAHMPGASWLIIAVFLIHRIELNSRRKVLVAWHLPVLALVLSLMLVCRLTNAFLFPMFVYLVVILWQRNLMPRALKLIPFILPALTPLLIEAVVRVEVVDTSAPTTKPLQRMGYTKGERFFWTRPALLRSLFSSRHGLFFATPPLLLAAWGLIWHMWRRGGWRDPFLACFVLSAILLWYINSAWYAWWFGPSVGNRGYVELAGLYCIGFAMLYVWMQQLRPLSRQAVFVLLGLFFAINYALMAAKLIDLVGDNETLIHWEDDVLGRNTRI